MAAAIGIGVAVISRRVSVGRALFLAIAGDLFVPAGLIVLLFASLLLGTGCLD